MIFRKKYSKIYNLIYKKKCYKKESDYIITLLKKNQILHNNILELGMGTGNHAIHMINKNYDVTGVEKSYEMLKIAKKIPKLICILEDIRSVRLNKNFDAVISLFHVINYMLTNSDINNFFKTANIHLKKGGLLIFDTWNDKIIKIGEVFENKFFKIDSYVIQRISSSKTIKNKVISINFKFIVKKNSKIISSFFEKHLIRYFSFKEINIFAKKNNFRLINDFGMLKFSKPTRNDKNICFVFKKLN